MADFFTWVFTTPGTIRLFIYMVCIIAIVGIAILIGNKMFDSRRGKGRREWQK